MVALACLSALLLQQGSSKPMAVDERKLERDRYSLWRAGFADYMTSTFENAGSDFFFPAGRGDEIIFLNTADWQMELCYWRTVNNKTTRQWKVRLKKVKADRAPNVNGTLKRYLLKQGLDLVGKPGRKCSQLLSREWPLVRYFFNQQQWLAAGAFVNPDGTYVLDPTMNNEENTGKERRYPFGQLERDFLRTGKPARAISLIVACASGMPTRP